MHQDQRNFLRRLLTAPAPSGYEERAAKVWRAEAASFADEVDHDVNGNSMAWLRSDHGPTVVIEGHIDEIGFVVSHVDGDGFVWFDKVGGWDDQVIVGQRVVIAAESGDVPGVIGKKAAHLLKAADREKVTPSSELWIDIGTGSREATLARIEIGDPFVLDAAPLELSNDLWVSRSVDNRVGAFGALEALRLLSATRPTANVIALAAGHEEITMAGALNAAHALKPAVAIAIDVTHATDYPGADKHIDNDVNIGGGPVLTRGSSINDRVFRGLQAAARQLEINTPIQAAARSSGTDADAFLRSGAGVASGLVSIPNRYMHSPNELFSLTDLEAAARLIAAFVGTIDRTSDFRP